MYKRIVVYLQNAINRNKVLICIIPAWMYCTEFRCRRLQTIWVFFLITLRKNYIFRKHSWLKEIVSKPLSKRVVKTDQIIFTVKCRRKKSNWPTRFWLEKKNFIILAINGDDISFYLQCSEIISENNNLIRPSACCQTHRECLILTHSVPYYETQHTGETQG